jgi:hypothetical protein
VEHTVLEEVPVEDMVAMEPTDMAEEEEIREPGGLVDMEASSMHPHKGN